jgi:hypothetical protein
MGKLALAGIISGMGNGLSRGLENMQSGIIQEGLMNRRFEHDDAAANVEREFQMRKMRDQQAHETAIQKGNQDFTAGQNQQKMGADIALHTGDRSANKELHEGDRDANAKLHADDRAATKSIHDEDRKFKREELDRQGTLKNRELDITEQFYKARGAALMNKAQATGKPDWKAVEIYNGMLKEDLDWTNKRLEDPMLDGEERRRLERHKAELMRSSRAITGIQGQEPVPTNIIDPDEEMAGVP